MNHHGKALSFIVRLCKMFFYKKGHSWRCSSSEYNGIIVNWVTLCMWQKLMLFVFFCVKWSTNAWWLHYSILFWAALSKLKIRLQKLKLHKIASKTINVGRCNVFPLFSFDISPNVSTNFEFEDRVTIL